MGEDSISDNQERRSGIDRRKLMDRRLLSFEIHIPERRGSKERRSGLDRRQEQKTSDTSGASEAGPIKLDNKL